MSKKTIKKREEKSQNILEDRTQISAKIVSIFSTHFYNYNYFQQICKYIGSILFAVNNVARNSEADACTCREDSRCSHKMHRPETLRHESNPRNLIKPRAFFFSTTNALPSACRLKWMYTTKISGLKGVMNLALENANVGKRNNGPYLIKSFFLITHS